MEVICLGCGEDIAKDRVKRLLQSDASQHILPLWSSILQDEFNFIGVNNTDVADLVSNGGKMCRKCFTTLERCSRIEDDLKESARKVARVVSQQSGDNVRAMGSADGRTGGRAGRSGRTVHASTQSPDVTVSNMHV